MAKDETFDNSLTLMIRTTINKKRVDVGTVDVPYPTLQDVDSKLSLPDKFQEDEDGGKSPVYEDDAAQWAQDAILDAVKREARNVTKVVEDKDAKSGYRLEFTRPIPANFEQLCEEHKRQGGEYLKIRHEAIADFGNWLTSLDKSQKAMDMAKKLFSDPAALDVSPIKTRETFLENYLSPYVEQLETDNRERYDQVLTKVITSAESDTAEADDF
jgi:hypothetical protein